VRLDQVQATFDRRLDPNSAAPVAVGFSGGGDSLALLLLTPDWARAHGRPVLSLTVDHQLQPDSAAWTRDAVAKAARSALKPAPWPGPATSPPRACPAAARRARHALLAQAARDAGAKVLLLGHTANDLAEAAAMRAEGSSVSDPRDWSPSPVWPEGRGVMLLRPLLGDARRNLRQSWLTGARPGWTIRPMTILRYARARARTPG
jgi:tRNA(Ile)-lysidine synthase